MSKQEIAPCPFCGSECVTDCTATAPGCWVLCDASCGYESGGSPDKAAAIAAHNRVATAIPCELLEGDDDA